MTADRSVERSRDLPPLPEIRFVSLCQTPIVADDQDVLCVLPLCCVCEIEAARNRRRSVDHDNFVMCDGDLIVDPDGDLGAREDLQNAALPSLLRLIEDRADIDAALAGVVQRLGAAKSRNKRARYVRLNSHLESRIEIRVRRPGIPRRIGDDARLTDHDVDGIVRVSVDPNRRLMSLNQVIQV